MKAGFPKKKKEMKCAGPNCNKKLKNGNQKYCSNPCKQKAAYLRKKKRTCC